MVSLKYSLSFLFFIPINLFYFYFFRRTRRKLIYKEHGDNK